MAQSSGPISQGTTAERQFTDTQWRDLFGDEAGVIGDVDGSAYALNLGGGGDVINVGSSTQASIAKVAGFAHRIPQSSPEPITIPAASGSTRTDVIALRYDPAYVGLPGPVRLVRIAGTTASIPSYDAAAPGVEELPLWAVTRAVGQALSQATVQRMFPRIALMMELSSSAVMPTSSPLGTGLRVGNTLYWRRLSGSNVPEWGRAENQILLGNGHLAAKVTLAETPTYTDLASVTATSLGGLCVVKFMAAAFNGASGLDRTMDVRVLVDSTVLGSFNGLDVPVNNASPAVDDGRTVITAGSFSSTPAAGSHTWKIQARASSALAVVTEAATLEVVEK